MMLPKFLKLLLSLLLILPILLPLTAIAHADSCYGTDGCFSVDSVTYDHTTHNITMHVTSLDPSIDVTQIAHASINQTDGSGYWGKTGSCDSSGNCTFTTDSNNGGSYSGTPGDTVWFFIDNYGSSPYYSYGSSQSFTLDSNGNLNYSASGQEPAPTTTASLSPAPYTDATYSDPTTVTLSASAAAGYTVANTYYTVDGGSQQTYSSPFTVNGSGSHTITYWSVDNNGVQESPNTKTFSITEAYSLSGTVYTDTNHNGVQDNGEQGYNNAAVAISQNNQTIASTTTNSSGSYSFPSLEAGSYSVTVTVPSGDIATTTNPATVDLTANTTQNFGIALAVTTLTASQDSFIAGISPNSNNGAGTYLQLTRTGHERALVAFNQSQIQSAIGDDPNYTASLVFTITYDDNNWGATGRQIDVDRLTQNWVEGNGSFVQNLNKGTGSGVTWNCAIDANISGVLPNCSGSTAWDMTNTANWPFVSTPTATATITNNKTGTVSFNVTADVQAFLSGTTNNGWVVRKDDETKDGVIQFSSREGDNAPELIITDY